MALRGNLRDFSLPDVFQLVTLSGKTGVLRLRRPNAEGSVWFRDGSVFFAQSDWQHEPLGQRLVSAGKITPSALTKALEIQKAEPEGGRRLGHILVDEGYVTDTVLEAFVQEQIQDTIFDLFRWDEGDFDFETLESVPDEDIGLSVSIENVVMEGSRRLEEWTRIRKKIPSMGIVFKMATAPGEGTFDISLKPTEWSLLLKVDGTRAVADLARETGRTDFEVARIVYGLFSAGLLEVASDEEVERLRADRQKLEASIGVARPEAPAVEEPSPSAVAQAAAPAAAEAPVAPVEAVTASAAADAESGTASAATRVVDEPAFLSAGLRTGGPDDTGTLQEMMGAVLEAPAVESPLVEAVEATATAPALEEEEEALAPPVAEAQSDVYMFEDQQAPASVEAPQAPGPFSPAGGGDGTEAVAPGKGASELTGLLETLERPPAVTANMSEQQQYVPVVVEPASVKGPAAGGPVPSGDLAADLMALGLGELPATGPEEMTSDHEPTIAELEAAARAAELGDATIAEIETAAHLVAPAAGDASEDLKESPTHVDGPDATAGAEVTAQVLDSSPEGVMGGSEAPDSGVISTAAFLSDFGDSNVTFSAGLGDEITALTGGGGGRQRPSVNVASIPDAAANGQVLHRDSHVDRDLLLRIIEGVQHL